MAGEIASAFVRIRPNMTGFKAETESGVKSAFSGLSKIVGVALGATAAFEIGKSAVESAADIQKQIEVIRYEFGGFGEDLVKFADTTGTAFGDANRVTDKASARFGLLFKSLGVGKEQAAEMTLGFEKLALSVNAIRGGGAEGAATLLQQIVLAAAGNTRGLKQMGIVVDANSEKIAAFKLGLIQTMNQALTPAQKTEAIYAIATAHLGETLDLARKHAHDFANVQARLSAEWMQAKEALGVGLLPLMSLLADSVGTVIPAAVRITIAVFSDLKTVLMGAFDFVSPLLKPIIEGFHEVRAAFAGGGGITGALQRIRADFDKLSPAAKVAVVAIGGIAAALAGITIAGSPILAIVALGVAFGEAYRRSADFRQIIGSVGDFLKSKVEPAFRQLAGALNPVFEVLTNKVAPAIGRFAESVVRGLGRAFSFVEAHKRVFEVLGATIGGIALAFGVLEAATAAWAAATTIATAVQTAFDVALDANPIGIIVLAIGALVGALVALYFKSSTVRNVLHSAFAGVAAVVHGAVAAFRAILPTLEQVGQTIRTVFADAFQVVRPAVTRAVQVVRGAILVIAEIVRGGVSVLQAIWHHFGRTIIAVVKGAFSILAGTIRGALQVIRGVIDVFTGIFTGDWRKAWNGIKEIVHGVLHALTTAFHAWKTVTVTFFRQLWQTIEKIVLKGVNFVVGLLAKIPTSFSVFGHHFGFTNPFKGWNDTLTKTIGDIGKTGQKAAQVAGATASQAADAIAHANANALRNTVNDAKKKSLDAANDPAQKSALKKVGKDAGATVAQATADGITQGVKTTLPGVSKTISDAVHNAIQAAHRKIVASVEAAKNNLDKIGQDLAKSIEQIQQKIGGAAGAIAGSPQGQAFAKLKKLIESGAPAFEIQRASAAFSSQLQGVGKQQQSQIKTQLANLTSAFAKGKIGYTRFESRLHEILSKNGITLREALKAGGPAFAEAFKAQVRALGQQAKAIAAIPAKYRGLGGAGGAADIKIIRPLEVIRDEQRRIAVAAAKQRQAQLKATQKTNAELKSLKQVRVGPLPGHHKQRHGKGSKDARSAARVGNRG